MSTTLDDYGLLRLPGSAQPDCRPLGDPGLGILGEYLAKFLNQYATDIWNREAPATPVVRTVLYHDPEKSSFKEQECPALFLWRGGSMNRPEWVCEDMRVSTEQIFVHWVAPAVPQDKWSKREPFHNVIGKAIDNAIARERDPCFVLATESDPKALEWGTHIWTALKAWSLEVVSVRPKELRIKRANTNATIGPFPGVLVTVELQEQLAWNHDNYDPTDEMRGAISNAGKNDEADPAGAMKLVDWVISST